MVTAKVDNMLFGLVTSRYVIVYLACFVLLGFHGAASVDNEENYRMALAEEQQPGTMVANLAELFSVRAGERAGRSFEILGQRMMSGHKVIASDGEWLAIDKTTGVISVNHPVDREVECGEDYELECVISLQTAMMPQAHFRMQNFELVITDVNDHAPKFPTTGEDNLFSLNISEDTPEHTKFNLDQFLATDEDYGDNALIRYSISRNDHFALNQFMDDMGAPHLELVVISRLDYEKTKIFDLTLTARDKGTPTQRSAQVYLRINVVDANDNAPVFDETEYELQLREDLPAGHVITTVVARDVDTGRFGKVRYFVPKAGNSVTARRLVDVDAETGVVKMLRPLDWESRDNLRIVIAARDMATEAEGGRKVGKTVLVISVADVNDNSPRIHVNIILKGENKAAYIPEDVKIGTYVAHVSVTDADKGQSGEVKLSITATLDQSKTQAAAGIDTVHSRQPTILSPDVSDQFILMKGNLIATNAKLDREKHDKYILIISACDGGNPPRCSKKNVSAVILDTNDNAPKFQTQKKSFVLTEGTAIGTHVTSIVAYDDDSLNTPAQTSVKDGKFATSRNGEVRYSLQGGGAVFAIESKTGKLTLVGALDYETRKTWNLVVVAQDLGNPPRRTNLTVKVEVTDVNDHKPEFLNPAVANATVYATILEDRTITKIRALDRDSGANAQLWYEVTSEDGSKRPYRFILDPVTGNLRFNSSNKLKQLLGRHLLTIKAHDKGKPPLASEMRVFVEVSDLPLSSLIPDYDDGEGQETSKITVIVLASLASATVVLLLILACIVVKCRKENKEIRTYNCRAAESKSGRSVSSQSKSNMSQIGSVDEVVVVSTPGVTTTRDVNFGKAMEMNRSRSMTLGNSRLDGNSAVTSKYATTERGLSFTTFSLARKPNDPNDSGNIVTSSHTDGDSGKGESDKDSDSYGGDKDAAGSDKNSQAPSETQSQYCSGYLNELGPRCTMTCRRYGHSDECWMPVVAHCEIHGDHDSFVYSDAGSEASDTAYSNKNYSEHYMPAVNSVSNRYGNFDNCGLETISETQPLRLVLENTDQTSMYSCDSYRQDYPAYPELPPRYPQQQYYETNPNAHPMVYPTQAHYPLLPDRPDWRDVYRSPQPVQNTQHIVQPARPASVHRTSAVSPVPSGIASYPQTENMVPQRLSRPSSIVDMNDSYSSSGSVMEKVKRFSQQPVRRPSLRDHVLNSRLAARAGNDSSNVSDAQMEEALLRDVQNGNHNTDDFESSNGEVSLEETRKIISDIDHLISS